MVIELAPRLGSLNDRKLVFLDCGKRGGAAILHAAATQIAALGAVVAHEGKTSAHRMAAKRLIEKLSSE